MANLFFGLRARLLFLVVLAVLPALAMVLFNAVQQRRSTLEQVRQGVLSLSQFMATDQEKDFAQADLLLSGLARLPDLRTANPEVCSGTLAAVHGGRSPFLNIGVLRAEDGSHICSVVRDSAQQELTTTELAAVRRAVSTGRFAVSRLVLRDGWEDHSLLFVHPIASEDGEVESVIYASYSVAALNRRIAESGLPEGTTLTLADRGGTIFARKPASEEHLGRQVGGDLLEAFNAAAPGSADRAFRAHDFDGLERLFGAVAVRLPDESVVAYLGIGLPLAEALAPASQTLVRNLILLALLSLLALTAAWFGGDYFVLRRVDALLTAARRLEAGDRSARSGIGNGKDELEQLGHAFDEMAATLEARQEEAEAAADALRQSEESYRALFDNLSDLVMINDLDGNLLKANAAVTRRYGPRWREFFNGSARNLIDTARTDLSAMDAAFDRVAAGGPRETIECWLKDADGSSFPSESVLTHCIHEGEPVVLIVSRDISERKEAEKELRNREDALRQAQKMEAVGRLAGGVAHDFNNLLAAIKGNIELVLLDMPHASPFREDLEHAQQAAETAASLTRQLLAFSRHQTVEPRVLDLNGVVSSTTRLLQRLIGAEIELRVDLGSTLWSITADPSQLEQVLLNLTVNARDAMPGGGELLIETRNVIITEHARRRPANVEPGEYVQLSVTDTGVGIDSELQDRIFEPFFTTKSTDKATGLGLFTVYGIAKQTGGGVWVESGRGRGTTVRVLFPRSQVLEAPPPPPTDEAPSTGTETILVVDDEPSVRLLASRILTRIGYHVLVAENGPDAIQVSDRFEGKIDLLLTDMTMPRMAGTEVAREVVRRRPDIRTVFMSGYSEETLPGGLGEMTFAPSFIQKPFTLNILGNVVRATLDREASGK